MPKLPTYSTALLTSVILSCAKFMDAQWINFYKFCRVARDTSLSYLTDFLITLSEGLGPFSILESYILIVPHTGTCDSKQYSVTGIAHFS